MALFLPSTFLTKPVSYFDSHGPSKVSSLLPTAEILPIAFESVCVRYTGIVKIFSHSTYGIQNFYMCVGLATQVNIRARH